MNVVFFLLGDSPESEFYVPTFRNALFHLHRLCKLLTLLMDMELTECSETSAQGNHPPPQKKEHNNTLE